MGGGVCSGHLTTTQAMINSVFNSHAIEHNPGKVPHASLSVWK